MKLYENSLDQFTQALASKTSVPGGGGAAAAVAAIGVALGDMVGEFTLGKKKYAAVEDDIKSLMDQAQTLRGQLLECIEEDAAAFEPLSKAYGISKEDPDRDKIMENCLRQAAQPPFHILELACKSLDIVEQFADKGSVIVLSDAACGAALLRGALLSAAANVKINTKSMKDREYADSLNAKTNQLVEKYSQLADDIFNKIYSKY